MVRRSLYSICAGLVVGAVMPIVLLVVLVVADGILINFVYRYYQIGFGLKAWQLYILLIPIEIIGLFFAARYNRPLAAAALISAVGVMILLLRVIQQLPTLS